MTFARLTIACKNSGCRWRLHASCIEGGPKCQIKKNREEHKCGGTQHLGNKEVSSKWLAETTLEKFKDHPTYTPKELIGDVRREKGVTISYRVAWKAKESAHAQIHGDHVFAYQNLRNYCQNILEANPGSVAHVQETIEGRFLRIFIAYNASINGFMHCRPIIGLDGTHLKGKYLGILLTATTIDAQGALFPIAFGVVIVENDDDWCWFLQSLKDVLRHTDPLTFISDRQKGLVDGVMLVFGNDSSHGYCMRHLSDNFRKAFKSTQLLGMLWKAADATNTQDFDVIIGEIRTLNSNAAEWLMSTADPSHWATCKFSGKRFGHLTSNIAESLNAWLLEARAMPILGMMELIRQKIMSWFYERRINGETSKARTGLVNGEITRNALVGYAEKFIRESIQRGRLYRILPSTNDVFEIHTPKHVRIVYVDKKICTCGQWQDMGLPCAHAAAAILFRKERVQSFAHKAYLLQSYCDTYKEPIFPVVVTHDNFVPGMLPPATRRPPGRPKTKRIRTIEEGTKKKEHRCGRCRGKGHNARSCRAPI